MRHAANLLLVSGLVSLLACDEVQSPQTSNDSGVIEESLLDVTQEVVASGFSIPWAIAVIGDDEYLISERLGSLYHYRNGETVALEGIPRVHTSEFAGLTYGGVMDVSLHPGFDTNHLVYLAYVSQIGRMEVARFTFVDGSIQDLRVIFRSNAFSIGSRIEWEDADHFFITQGVGGNPGPEPGPQDLSDDRGKIHRLVADGSVPVDNPVFKGYSRPSSIWTYGHRDPQGLFLDRDEGVLYETEHGPMGGDEFNVIRKGGNYGWPLFSYGRNYDDTPVGKLTEEEAARKTILPEKYWLADFTIAPSGLVRLEGILFPELKGYFLLGSLRQRRLIAYDVESRKTIILLNNIGRVRDVAELPGGSLLILIDAGSPRPTDSGRIVKLTPR